METYEHSLNNRRRYYRGAAKVGINFLKFEDGTVPGGRFLDQRNVHRLVQIYESEGYRPLEPENRVPALISQEQLDIAMDISNVSQADLQSRTEPPELYFDSDNALLCLSGKHRVAAAAATESIRPADKWCVVEMFTDGMLDARASSLTSSSNELKIFQNLRSSTSVRSILTRVAIHLEKFFTILDPINCLERMHWRTGGSRGSLQD